MIYFVKSIEDTLDSKIPGDDYRFIAPYSVDLSTNHGNARVYYREVTSGPLLVTASKDVQKCNSGQSGFSANWVFIATWKDVTYCYGDATTPVSVSNMTTKVNA